MNYEELTQNESRFLAMTSLTVEEFGQLVGPFEQEYVRDRSTWTDEGYQRWGRRHTGQNLALALQFSVYSPEQQSTLRKIQSREYDAIRKYTDTYDEALPDEITQSMFYSFRAFLIPKIGNHAKSSDVAIEFARYNPDDKEEIKNTTNKYLSPEKSKFRLQIRANYIH